MGFGREESRALRCCRSRCVHSDRVSSRYKLSHVEERKSRRSISTDARIASSPGLLPGQQAGTPTRRTLSGHTAGAAVTSAASNVGRGLSRRNSLQSPRTANSSAHLLSPRSRGSVRSPRGSQLSAGAKNATTHSTSSGVQKLRRESLTRRDSGQTFVSMTELGVSDSSPHTSAANLPSGSVSVSRDVSCVTMLQDSKATSTKSTSTSNLNAGAEEGAS